jgi:hypothetical protein
VVLFCTSGGAKCHMGDGYKHTAEGELCFVLSHGISYKPFGEWDSLVSMSLIWRKRGSGAAISSICSIDFLILSAFIFDSFGSCMVFLWLLEILLVFSRWWS